MCVTAAIDNPAPNNRIETDASRRSSGSLNRLYSEACRGKKNLVRLLDVLAGYTRLSDDMLLVGGGGKSRFWRQLFADIYNKSIVESRVGEDAGSLGAAAASAIGTGLWQDFDPLKKLNTTISRIEPDAEHVAEYNKLLPIFAEVARRQSEIGDLLHEL